MTFTSSRGPAAPNAAPVRGEGRQGMLREVLSPLAVMV